MADHSTENTQAVLKQLRDLIDEAGDAVDLDMWEAVKAIPNGAFQVQLDDDAEGLSYLLTLAPIVDGD